MTIETMKKFSKRLFSGLMVTLLLGGNLVSSVGAYAETVPTEPKTGETTGGESPTPPNGEKEASLPSLQDNLPKPTEPPAKEPPKVESPTEAPKAEEPKVDSKAKASPKEEPAKETESEDDEELPQLSNLEAGDSPKLPEEYGPGEDEKVKADFEHLLGPHVWISSTELDPTVTLHIGAGKLFDSETASGNSFTALGDFFGGIQKIKVEGPLILPENGSYIFEKFSARTFEGTHYLDTSRVKDMHNMFSESQFEKLDLSSFDTSNVVAMDSMFADMPNLREVNVSSFDTTNVLTMLDMFTATTSLNELNLSSFNTSNVRLFNSMFKSSSLATLDLSNFNLENKSVTDMMLNMRNLNKVILGPNTRLNPNMHWGFNTDGEQSSSWKNIDKLDLINLSPARITKDYNTNSSILSGTWILIGVKPVISVHDSTIYMETPAGVKPSMDWNPPDNLDYAYDTNGDSINTRDMQ
ncbi:TPA: BspA family leucine-rich repeat surface protein, partial [Enterococcus faecalis]